MARQRVTSQRLLKPSITLGKKMGSRPSGSDFRLPDIHFALTAEWTTHRLFNSFNF
jgi:hypothetical protein